MSRFIVFTLFFLAVFLQSGAYGLTFLLPDLFDAFGADEKDVGLTLMVTAIATLATVYYSGHLSDMFGRVATLGVGCVAIAAALFLYGNASELSAGIILASALLGAGWGLTYALAPVALARIVDGNERVRFFALLSIFVMAGFGLSPVMASTMLKFGFSVSDAFYVTSVFCAISAAIFFAIIKPLRAVALNPGAEPQSGIMLGTIRQVFKSRAALPVTMVFLGASVFAGMTNFQTVIAQNRGLDYSIYFLVYTLTVVGFRIILVGFKGGKNPYLNIAMLQYIMAASVVLFLFMGNNSALYIIVAILFGLGYGASYPILVAMAANDAPEEILPQTLQLFALTYFIGIFGFPLVAGWLIVESTVTVLLSFVALLAAIEASLALRRGLQNRKTT